MVEYHPLPEAFAPSVLLLGDYHCPLCKRQMFMRPMEISGILIFALRRINAINQTAKRPATPDDMSKLGRSVYCNYSALKYWGFIEAEQDESGWSITPSGQAFLAGHATAPKRLWIFDDKVRSVDESELGMESPGDVHIDQVREYVPKSRQSVRETMVALTPNP